ncbi:MAG: HPF/RaiA family ribosome-associated protein [Candidatus Aminicenantes bacterium]|nr:HPF/RaiA family ribosome-associated protein [Candidatus Aminicenantes bacterium]
MSINFVHKNVKMPGALKAYIEKHLGGIERIAGGIIDAEVIVNEEKLDFKVEISLKTRLDSFYAQTRDKMLKQAVRNTLATLKNQAKKSKEKIKEAKKRPGAKEFFQRPPGPRAGEKGEETGPAASGGILVSDNYSRKPLTVEEAVFYLGESRENGYMFVNSETNRVAGVFRNSRGGITLIEPDW